MGNSKEVALHFPLSYYWPLFVLSFLLQQYLFILHTTITTARPTFSFNKVTSNCNSSLLPNSISGMMDWNLKEPLWTTELEVERNDMPSWRINLEKLPPLPEHCSSTLLGLLPTASKPSSQILTYVISI